MSFVHPLLLSGLVLAGIPILVHLIMRQKPKHLLFPAMRFLLQRHRTNATDEWAVEGIHLTINGIAAGLRNSG